jgi:hypothetical protein
MDLPTDQTLDGHWRLDPHRLSVEFRAGHFSGLATVKGHFDENEGRLDQNGGAADDPAPQPATRERLSVAEDVASLCPGAVAMSIPRTRRVHLRCLSAR